MSELKFLPKKDAILTLKAFFETLSSAKNHLNYSRQKSDVEKYLKLLDVYSKKIDLDLNNSIMSLRLALAQNYGNTDNLNNEGLEWVNKWYTNFKIKTEYSIATLPNKEEYQPILDSFETSMDKINKKFEELEKKYEGLEKKITQPQQQANIPQKIDNNKSNKFERDLIDNENINSNFNILNKKINNIEKILDSTEIQRKKEQKELEDEELRKTQKISKLKSSINKIELENLIKITQQININLENICIFYINHKSLQDYLNRESIYNYMKRINLSDLEKEIGMDKYSKKFVSIEIDNNSIIRLDINDYSLTIIPNIKNLKNLVKLDLSHNRIKKTDNIKFLENLEYLDLSSNNISEVTLGNLKKLSSLNLSNNNIKSISNIPVVHSFSALHYNHPNLKNIYLDNNPLIETRLENSLELCLENGFKYELNIEEKKFHIFQN